MLIRTMIVIAAGVIVLTPPAFAQDATEDAVKDAVRDAMEFYDAGNYSEAATTLDYASQMIRQMKGEQVGEFLPEPLDGWTAEDTETTAVGAAMFGGGLAAERRYENGGRSITVRILADSPLLQSMSMMMTNPMIVSSTGARLEVIAGQRAIVRQDRGDLSISSIIANRYLIQVEGDRVEKADLEAYFKAIDFNGLKAMQ